LTGFLVRQMEEDDLDQVARVDLASFGWAAGRAGLPPVVSQRHLPGLRYMLGKARDLCLVATAPGGQEILGYLLGHRWGTTAWAGPFGVDVPSMRRGIGSAMLDEFQRRCIAGGANSVGLETSILGNVRFYRRKGYVSGGLRLLAVKDLGEPPAGPGSPTVARAAPGTGPEVRLWRSLGREARAELTAGARRLSERVWPGLDHTVEFDAVDLSGIGETLVAVWPGGDVAGYAVLHLLASRLPAGELGVAAAPAVEPGIWVMVGCEEAVVSLLDACEERAAAAGGRSLKVPWYAATVDGYLLLRGHGYRPEAACARMYLGDATEYAFRRAEPGGPAVLEFSGWLG